MNLNELRNEAYKNACEKGFYTKKRSDEHYLCLVITELCEAIQADRANKRANIEKFNWFQERSSDPDKMFNVDFETYILSTVEDELADAAIRLLSFAGLRGFNVKIKEDGFFEYEESVCDSETFTETIYAIIAMPLRLYYEYDYSRERHVNDMIAAIFELAEYMGIDLFKHIELKMKYNKTRSSMHGKKY